MCKIAARSPAPGAELTLRSRYAKYAPDGVIILEDGRVVGVDVVFAATAAAAKEQIREKRWGRGDPRDRAAAQAERAAVHAHVQAGAASGRMTAREAQDARYTIGLTLESSYHSGDENRGVQNRPRLSGP